MTVRTTISAVHTVPVPPRWIFVRVELSDGSVGWGECIVPKRVRAVRGAVADLADNIIGSDARRIEDLWQRMRRGSFFRGGSVQATAVAGIEQALWDLKARAAGLAVYEFLGGPVRERIRTYAWVGGDEPSDVVAHTRERIEQGFTAVKMNATPATDHLDRHGVIDDAVGRVAAIRERFGTELGIAVDFHGRVHRGVAKILLSELAPFRLMWAEEPVVPEVDGVLGHLGELAGPVPIATGERLTSRWEFARLLETGVVDVIQPDVSLTGLFELEKIARLAEIHDVAVAPHCPNGPISLAASLQVGFCCGNVVIQEQSGGIHYNQGYQDLPSGELFDYLSDPGPLRSPDGSFGRTDAPGLGVEVDTDAVRAAHTEWRLTDPDWRHADGRYAEW